MEAARVFRIDEEELKKKENPKIVKLGERENFSLIRGTTKKEGILNTEAKQEVGSYVIVTVSRARQEMEILEAVENIKLREGMLEFYTLKRIESPLVGVIGTLGVFTVDKIERMLDIKYIQKKQYTLEAERGFK